MTDNRRCFLKITAAAVAGLPSAIAQQSLANTRTRPWSTLTRQSPQARFAVPADAAKGFRVELTVIPAKFDGAKQILEIPGVLSIGLRQHDPLDRTRQNYPAFKLPDGTVPVLEASLALHSDEHPDWTSMTVGIPLAMLARPEEEHSVTLDFSGVRWTMYVDGQLLDNDFPFGYPQWPETAVWRLDPEFASKAALFSPAQLPVTKQAQKPIIGPIQYWTPPGHNTWVGDVATIFHEGRYHVFYLYDRRHHKSKFGKGAHYFEHLSTKDFMAWTEHEAATPIEAQWECIGTGTPFVFQNKLCLSYGLHTGRLYADEKTTWPAQWEYLKEHGQTRAFHNATEPGVPAGATYSVSADGVSGFSKSNITFHPCQNPSVYTDPIGKLRMLANAGSKGMWESNTVDGGWRCTNPSFPPGGDCTFFFRWGNFDYIIGGFTGLWSKPAALPDAAYENLVHKGLDFYDGSNVPAITAVPDGRFLMAAWIPIRSWGGNLVLRELVQFPDGRIGSKWMLETTPQTGKSRTLAASLADKAAFRAGSESFLLTFSVEQVGPGGGRFAVVLLAENGEEAACELQLDLKARRAQFGPGSLASLAAAEKTLREGGAPEKVLNYAIENLTGINRPFEVRIIVMRGDKIGGSLVDTEIAAERTMISYRPDLTVRKLVFHTDGVRLSNVRLAAIDTSICNL
jgi:beta-fructofuranosidase